MTTTLTKTKENKYLKNISMNIWRNGEHSIAMSITNPTTGEVKLTSVEHTEQRDGKQMKRTHNNLFLQLQSYLQETGQWNMEES